MAYYYLKKFQYNGNMIIVQVVQISDPNNHSTFAFMAGEIVKHITRQNKISFILDSGVSHHKIHRSDLIADYEELRPPNKISVAKNGTKRGALRPVSNLTLKVTWHQRLGHIWENRFLEIKNKQLVDDMFGILNIIPNDTMCETCINGTQSRLPFNK